MRLALFDIVNIRLRGGRTDGVRFLTFRMQQSFYGREDENLTDKLLAERPGILNLALDALDELRSRGKLLQSGSGVEMAERLGDLTSDVKVFV